MTVSTKSLAIGVDLGATKIASALVSSGGEVLASRQTLTLAAEGPEAVMTRLASEIDCLKRQAPDGIAGVGIGSPGQVEPLQGVVRNAVNLAWDEVHLAAGINARLKEPLPIRVQKDANASALGEYYFGAGQGCRDFVYISIGSGLGGGVISAGKVISGASGQAAELGHLSLNPQGRLCACGMRGCAETIVSGPGLVAVARERLLQDLPSLLHQVDDLTPSDILDAACQDDPLARAVLDELGLALGFIMAACVAILNPARFIIGGGLGVAAYDLIVPIASRELSRRALASSPQELLILPSRLKSSAVGAACLVWQEIES